MGTEENQTLAQYYAEAEAGGDVRDSFDGMTEGERSDWYFELDDYALEGLMEY
tara:strand:- start:2230 stop:2388 length:159 start_codon:yes stop_codon:yes gene_type:complete